MEQEQKKKVPPSKELSKSITEVSRELFEPVERTIGGPPIYITNPLARMDGIFNFQQEQYILIGSISGTGKTSILDHLMLSILDNHSPEIHYEVLYYSMERKKKFKYAKWLSWKMFVSEGLRVSSDTIMNRDGKMTSGKLLHLKTKYEAWINDILGFVDLREGRRTVKEVEQDIERTARRLGTYFHTDSVHIHKNGKIVGKLNTDQFINTKYGKKLFTRFKVKGKDYTLYQNDKVYITEKTTIVWIVIDHIGKIVIEGNKKATLDALDDVLSNARDKYAFSPVAISQFNRAVGSTERHKLHKGDLSPTMEDFKDTGNLTESADLVLSLFDPGRYKSWNAQGEYMGYNIEDKTRTPIGQQRARSLHVLKNTFGYDNNRVMLKFTGECMYFETMPKVTNATALIKMYADIAKGK